MKNNQIEVKNKEDISKNLLIPLVEEVEKVLSIEETQKNTSKVEEAEKLDIKENDTNFNKEEIIPIFFMYEDGSGADDNDSLVFDAKQLLRSKVEILDSYPDIEILILHINRENKFVEMDLHYFDNNQQDDYDQISLGTC